MSKLTGWINQELAKRGWSQRELARRARISPGALNLVLNERRRAGQKMCLALARALRVPADEVYRLAGFLPSIPDDTIQERQLLGYYRTLDSRDRDTLLNVARTLHEQRPEYSTEKGGGKK